MTGKRKYLKSPKIRDFRRMKDVRGRNPQEK